MRVIISTAIVTILLAVFCAPLAAQSNPPSFLFLLENTGSSTGTVHVFSVSSITGALTEVPGSPFNAGLVPEQLAVDPTGRFLYVANQQSEDITAFAVNSSIGALTPLPGSPFFIGAVPVTMGVDPTGRFLYVFAAGTINSVSEEFLYEFNIDSASGILTAVSSSAMTIESGPGKLVTSIAFAPAGNFAYLGQAASGALTGPILLCSVDFSSGALSIVSSVQATSGEADHVAVSPSGNFVFSTDSPRQEADGFAAGAGGKLSETSGSPYAVGNVPVQALVHPAGKFVYVLNQGQQYQGTPNLTPYTGTISAFAITPGTGALTAVAGSPFAAGINPAAMAVDPTGSFAYAVSTAYQLGTYSGFTEIQGFSVDPSSGALTPFPIVAWTDSAHGTGAGVVVSTAAVPPNPVPMISSLSPPSAVAAGPAFTLQVSGANFVPSATVYFAGQPRSTTFASSRQLNASILSTDINNEGVGVVFVFNPLPGGGTSTSVEFPVTSPVPSISSILPSSVTAGGNSFPLFAGGSNFLTSSVVNFNGTALPTVYVSSTVIRGQVPAADIVALGTATITVTNPANGGVGGGTSGPLTLTIVPPVAKLAVTSLSPTSVMAGGPAFTLTVNGSGFVPNSQVTFILQNVATTFVSSTQLTAAIPASDIAIAGHPYVIVKNPDGSQAVAPAFTVNSPQPGGGPIVPPGLPAGSNALTLNVAGTGFLPNSIVIVNGSARQTKYESSTLLLVTLLPADLAQVGTLSITVFNPAPGGGTSPQMNFTVEEDSLTPSSAPPPVTAGRTATFTFTFSSSSGAFANPVAFAVSPQTPLPAGAETNFEPSATIAPGMSPKTVTLSITTKPHTSASLRRFPRELPPGLPWIILMSVTFALAGIRLRSSSDRLRGLVPQLLLGCLLVTLGVLFACGGTLSGTSSAPQTNPATGTPAGIYPITITATSGGVTHTASVVLTVM